MNENIKLLVALATFAGLIGIMFLVYNQIFRYLKSIVHKTASKTDDFFLDLFKIPVLWLIYWIMFKIFSTFFLSEIRFYDYLVHINNLLLIFTIAWILTQLTKATAIYLQNRLDVNAKDNLQARMNLTQIKVFKRIINSLIIIIAFSLSLMTFEKARTIGMSLLTSAGIIGVIVGFAAQKSIGMILAGIQLAITQPIRIDDVVIVEGEWGRIEEITLTYVVVKIWDERRLVLPVNYFLEQPFQNWTRQSSEITGTVFLHTDYNLPVDAIRQELNEILKKTIDWDGRLANVQVTNSTER